MNNKSAHTTLTWFVRIDINGLHASSVRSELCQQGSAHHIPTSNGSITRSTKLGTKKTLTSM